MGSCASDAFARADLRPAIRGFYRRLVEGTFHLRHITLASRHQKLLPLSDGGYNPHPHDENNLNNDNNHNNDNNDNNANPEQDKLTGSISQRFKARQWMVQNFTEGEPIVSLDG